MENLSKVEVESVQDVVHLLVLGVFSFIGYVHYSICSP